MSGSKLDLIEASIANFLPRLPLVDRRRWLSIREAVDRARSTNIAAGVSSDIVRIGIESLERIEPGLVDLTGEGEDDGSKATSPTRRSSRRSVKAEKARAMEEDDEDEGSDHENGEEGSEGDDERGAEGDEEDGGGDEDQAPREKKKAMYLPFDAGKHFYWAKAVSYGFLSYRRMLTCSFSASTAPRAIGSVSVTYTWRAVNSLHPQSVRVA
jgi:hypothetical protein